MNVAKCKIFVFENNEFTECKVSIDGERIEQMNEFIHLGYMFSKDLNLKEEHLQVLSTLGTFASDMNV